MNRLLMAAPIGAALFVTAALAQSASPPAPPAAPAITDAKTGTMFVAEDGRDLMSSKLVGAKVINASNENIGEIADLMLSEEGHLRAVVIGVGGVMGVGAHYVAVAPAALKMGQNADKSIKVMMDASKDELKAAPEFKYQKS